ncbi:hypothetical protein EB233_02410 [Mesorhizobium erdmanii]|uniref:Uncharacterized protein n=1 Tax=Mesorhizobium erdmanii TaxID=1777866 RepID=A0A6M7UC77_9HYPH|nr:hypothetical protein EB233_02410 [Mesorhizobium erdmanii]
MPVAQKWPRFWADDMHKNRAGDRNRGRKTGVPPIVGTPCSTIRANLERDAAPNLFVTRA